MMEPLLSVSTKSEKLSGNGDKFSARNDPSSSCSSSSSFSGVIDKREQVLYSIAEVGVEKHVKKFTLILFSAVYAGIVIGLGAALYLKACETSGQLVGSLVFPAGLSMVLTLNIELLTSNMFYALATMLLKTNRKKQKRLAQAFKLFAGSLLGNCVGCIAMASVCVMCDILPNAELLESIAMKKTQAGLLVIFTKGIFANFLVNLGIWNTYLVEDMLSKIAIMWIPIFSFCFLGFEHSVANVFTLSLSYMTGTLEDLTFLQTNLIPCVLGNFAGAFLFAMGQVVIVRAGRKSTKLF